MSVGALAFLALIAFGASACGRRGALEPPPDPNAVAKTADDNGGLPQAPHKPKPVTPPKEPFVLDPLL
jgi:predicted small lipoprotein YifL